MLFTKYSLELSMNRRVHSFTSNFKSQKRVPLRAANWRPFKKIAAMISYVTFVIVPNILSESERVVMHSKPLRQFTIKCHIASQGAPHAMASSSCSNIKAQEGNA